MSTRLKQLYKRAYGVSLSVDDFVLGENEKKFAELIVRECASIPSWCIETGENQLVETLMAERVAKLICKHLGIGELTAQSELDNLIIDNQRPDQNALTPEFFKGPYWEDHCPQCGEKAVDGCRCPINDRTCPNGHTWHRRNGRVVLGSGH